MAKKFLYCYFGNIVPYDFDIPGHFLYQPFLIEEICSKVTKEDYSVDLYSYISPDKVELPKTIQFDHYLWPLNVSLNLWAERLGTTEPRNPYVPLDTVLPRIYDDYYDYLFLKARFRNPSTHGKKLYDVKKFEAICELAINRNTPTLIIDTDLALPEAFIEDVINANDNIKIVGLGDVLKAYPNLNPEKVFGNIPLYGISLDMLKKLNVMFTEDPYSITDTKNDNKVLLYYGNIASANYKKGHTKNYEILEYLIKLSEEKFFEKIKGYIVGKIEDSRFVDGYKHILRYKRREISELHKIARISVNISKELYEKTDFSPARITEAWTYGILPLSYSADSNYQNNKTLTFKNYQEFLECIRLYLVDTGIEDYYKMFLNTLQNNIAFREKELSSIILSNE